MIDRLSSLHVVKTVSVYEQENYYRITVTTSIRTLHDNIVLSSHILYAKRFVRAGRLVHFSLLRLRRLSVQIL